MENPPFIDLEQWFDNVDNFSSYVGLPKAILRSHVAASPRAQLTGRHVFEHAERVDALPKLRPCSRVMPLRLVGLTMLDRESSPVRFSEISMYKQPFFLAATDAFQWAKSTCHSFCVLAVS